MYLNSIIKSILSALLQDTWGMTWARLAEPGNGLGALMGLFVGQWAAFLLLAWCALHFYVHACLQRTLGLLLCGCMRLRKGLHAGSCLLLTAAQF